MQFRKKLLALCCLASFAAAAQSNYPCDFKTELPTPNWKQAHLTWPGYVPPIAVSSTLTKDASGRVFFVGTDGKVYNYYWDNNTDWEIQALNYGQWATIDPAGGLKIDATGKIFCIGTDKKVYNFYYQNNAWQFGVLVSNQYALIDARGGLTINAAGQVFAIGTDGKVYNYYWTGSSWAFNWLNPNQYATMDARGGLALDASGKVFAIGTDGKVYNYYWNGSSWSFNWLNPNQYATMDARGKLLVDNSGKVFAIGTDGKVYNYYWNGSSWSFNWLVSNPYGLLNPLAGLTMDATGKIFGIGTDGKVYNYYWNGSAWAFNWLVSNPYMTANASGGMQIDATGKIFVIGTDGKLYNYYWNGSAWAFNWLSSLQSDPARAGNQLAVNNMVYYVDNAGELEVFYYSDSQINYNDWDIIYDENFTTTTIATLQNNWVFQYPWGPDQTGQHLANYDWEHNIPGAFSISSGQLHITANNQPVWASLDPSQGPNVILSDGIANYRQFNFTSGAMTNTTPYTYGLFEINCRLPAGKGFWPAFWMTGAYSWPPEMDIFEFDGTTPTRASNNMIWSGENCGMDYGAGTDLSQGFHKYSIAWFSDKVIFYLDGKELRTVDHHVPQTAMYVMANLAVGLHYPDNTTPFPSNYDIDYIKFYNYHPHRLAAPESNTSACGTFEVFPNPADDHLALKTSNADDHIKHTELYDIEGNLVSEQYFNELEETTLDLSNLAAGTYVVRIYSDSGVQSKKFIKN